MESKVTFKISGVRRRKQHNRQVKAYQRLIKAERQLQEFEEGDAMVSYRQTKNKFLDKFNIYDDIIVMGNLIWNDFTESENFSLSSFSVV